MRTWSLSIVATIAVFLLAGCSIFTPSRQIVALNVQPVEAEVILNGLIYPGGSIFAEVAPDQELLISVRALGYLPYRYVVPTGLSSTGYVDAWGSILILPFFGLFAPGAWQLEESVVNIALQPDPDFAAREKAAAESLKRAEGGYVRENDAVGTDAVKPVD